MAVVFGAVPGLGGIHRHAAHRISDFHSLRLSLEMAAFSTRNTIGRCHDMLILLQTALIFEPGLRQQRA
jgi:hypothetical protein